MKPLSIDPTMVFVDTHEDIVNAAAPGVPSPGLQIAARPGHVVSSYIELLRKIAALQYYNPAYCFLFRGQSKDYRCDASGIHSSLYPTILRSTGTEARRRALGDRFRHLGFIEKALLQRLPLAIIHQDRFARWALIQHYELALTPLLDVTRSLQAALSFALLNEPSSGYLFVFAVPHLSGPLSVSLESGTAVIDLTRLCPPEALRPHFQSGMLIGDYPVVDAPRLTHGGRGSIGNNFACRLFGKFCVRNCESWQSEGWTPLHQDILFPNKIDTWYGVLKGVATVP